MILTSPMDAFSSAMMFGNIILAQSMPSGGGSHSITAQRQSTEPWHLPIHNDAFS